MSTSSQNPTSNSSPVCECGDPRCVYVQNLSTLLENLQRAAGTGTQGRAA